MKKKLLKRVKLNRETLRQLESGSLRKVVAAGFSPDTDPGHSCCAPCSMGACTTG